MNPKRSRLRFRQFICVSAIGLTLGAAVLSEAAGPREFISKLWNKRPKVSTIPDKVADSRLNPRNWMNRGQADSGKSVSDFLSRDDGNSHSITATRPDLYDDPFAVTPEKTSTASQGSRSASQAAPSPRQRREMMDAEAQRLARTQRHLDDQKQTAARESAAPSAPALPNGLESNPSDIVQANPRSAEEPVSEFLRGGSNQFSEEFDQEFNRLVQSVLAEKKAEDNADEAEAPSDTSPLRRPVAAPSLADSAESPLRLPDNTDSSTPTELINGSRHEMATTLTIPADDDRSLLTLPPQQQKQIALTDGTGQHQRPIRRKQHQATPFGPSSPDMRHGWTAQSPGQPAMEPTHETSSHPLQPRVISNGAPPRSVPNNREYQRISYTSDGNMTSGVGRVIDAPRQVALAPPPEEFPDRHTEPRGTASAPIIDWSLDDTGGETATNSIPIPWPFASVLVVSIAVLLAIALLKRRQVVTVVTTGPESIRESD